MRFDWKRICALLLTLALALSLLPGGFARAEAATQELSAADYARADLVFDKIEDMEQTPAKKNATQTQKTNAAVTIVEASDSYAEGSLERNGDVLTWWTEDGIRCMYNPRMQKLRENMKPENMISQAVNEPTATRGGTPSGKQVYLIGPYYGADENFGAQYRVEAREVAQAIGDTDGFTLFSGKAATVDKVAEAVSNGAVVFFDSHGTTDYQNNVDKDDFITGATCSYLCLTSKDGLTTQDYNDGASYGGGDVFVNGKVIANHMTKKSPNGLVWMALCLGMGTDGMYKPLRDNGVAVVYGYSESVTFYGDYLYEETFWDEMKSGKTVAQAVATMKNKWGDWDWSDKMVGYDGYSSLAEARADYIAFPVVVSDEDAHPGQRTAYSYGADSLQTVRSTYTLGQVYPVTDPTDPKVILEEAYALYPGETLPYEATLTGKITQVYTPYNAQYGNVTVIMEIPGYETMPIKCYRLAGNGADQIGVGDTITVKGSIVNYEHSSGNTEVEFQQGCALIAWTEGDIEIDVPINPDIPVGDAATLYFNDLANRVSFATTMQVWQQNGVTAINEKTSESSNLVSYYDPVRFYAKSKLTIQSKDMAKVVVKCSSDSYASELYNSINIAGAKVTLSGSEVTIELAEPTDSIVIASLKAQIRVHSISVYAAQPEPVIPENLPTASDIFFAIDFGSSMTVNALIPMEVLDSFDSYSVKLSAEGREPVVLTSGGNYLDTYYEFAYANLTVLDVAKTVNVELTVTKGGQSYTTTDQKSILSFCETAIANSTSDAEPCAFLLQYAKAAAAYKEVEGVEVSAAAQSIIDGSSLKDALPGEAIRERENGQQISFLGQSLDMTARIAINFHIDLYNYAGDVNALTFDVNGKAYSFEDLEDDGDGIYVLSYSDFDATEMSKPAKCTVKVDGQVEAWYETSVERYCRGTLNNTENEATMIELAKCIYRYGAACAKAYGN